SVPANDRLSGRVVEKDNTVAIRDRWWQIDKTRFRNTLAGSTVTIHEHLEGTVSIRYGPQVVGGYSRTGERLISATGKQRRGKGADYGFCFGAALYGLGIPKDAVLR